MIRHSLKSEFDFIQNYMYSTNQIDLQRLELSQLSAYIRQSANQSLSQMDNQQIDLEISQRSVHTQQPVEQIPQIDNQRISIELPQHSIRVQSVNQNSSQMIVAQQHKLSSIKENISSLSNQIKEKHTIYTFSLSLLLLTIITMFVTTVNNLTQTYETQKYCKHELFYETTLEYKSKIELLIYYFYSYHIAGFVFAFGIIICKFICNLKFKDQQHPITVYILSLVCLVSSFVSIINIQNMSIMQVQIMQFLQETSNQEFIQSCPQLNTFFEINQYEQIQPKIITKLVNITYVFVASILFYIIKYIFNKFHIRWFNVIQIDNNTFMLISLITQFHDNTVMVVVLILIIVINMLYTYIIQLFTLYFGTVCSLIRIIYTVSHIIIFGILCIYLYASDSVPHMIITIVGATGVLFAFNEYINVHFTMNSIKTNNKTNDDQQQTAFVSENIVTVYLATIMDKQCIKQVFNIDVTCKSQLKRIYTIQFACFTTCFIQLVLICGLTQRIVDSYLDQQYLKTLVEEQTTILRFCTMFTQIMLIWNISNKLRQLTQTYRILCVLGYNQRNIPINPDKQSICQQIYQYALDIKQFYSKETSDVEKGLLISKLLCIFQILYIITFSVINTLYLNSIDSVSDLVKDFAAIIGLIEIPFQPSLFIKDSFDLTSSESLQIEKKQTKQISKTHSFQQFFYRIILVFVGLNMIITWKGDVYLLFSNRDINYFKFN